MEFSKNKEGQTQFALPSFLKNMEHNLKIGDVVAFKANKNIQLVITGIGADGIVLLRYYDTLSNEFKKIEMPGICFAKVD